MTLGSAGANQTWNYAWLVPATTNSPDIYVNTVAVNTAPYYFAFPSANNCQKVSFTYNSFLFESYSFSKVDNTGIETFGASNSAGVSSQYSDTPFIPLPLQYGDNYVDTYQTTTDPTPTSTNNTYDAYGTLTTPYGTFTNVVRIKQVGDESTNYSWIKASPYIPLMSIHVDNVSGNITYVTVHENTGGLSVNGNSISQKAILYPNPVTDYINLKFSDNQVPDKVMITDSAGKTLLSQTYISQINVESLAAGVYFLNVQSGENSYQTKFVKQ